MFEPPLYVLLQPNHPSTSSAPATFVHPVIEYHFADDPATALLPTSANESVLVLDYSIPDATPTVQSLHPGSAISNLRIVDAPGVASAQQAGPNIPNDKMYIIETVSSIEGTSKDTYAYAHLFKNLNLGSVTAQSTRRLATGNG